MAIKDYLHQIGLYQPTLKAWRLLHGKPANGLVENPFASHVPVLTGLSSLFKISRVLEFGCGFYSTLTFVNPDIYKDLMEIQSFENDLEWYNQVKDATRNDSRITLNFVKGPIPSIVSSVNLEPFDLIFIDDSVVAEERAATIKAVAAKMPSSALVVIHDFENPVYRNAAVSFKNQFVFKTFNPYTGLLWKDHPVNRVKLEALNQVIKTNANRIKLDDRPGWMDAFQSFREPHP